MYRYFITRLEEKQSLIDKRPADTLVQIIFGLLTDSNDNNIEEEHFGVGPLKIVSLMTESKDKAFFHIYEYNFRDFTSET